MSVVITEQTGAVRHIVLNRPEALNAMTDELVAAVGAAFREANGDGSVRAIVFRGAGRAFCAGADLKARRQARNEAEARKRAESIQDVTRAIVFGDTPVVGAIHGWAVGGGFEWALNCDFPIWAEGARGFFPEVEWGLFVTGGVSAILPNLIGLQKAKEMLFFGERHTAETLCALGIAWRTVPEDKLFEEAQAVAERLAALPDRAVRDMKRVLNRAAYGDVAQALEREVDAVVRSYADPETFARTARFAQA